MTQTIGTVTIDARPQQDSRLGRQMVHDERSRAFVLPRGAVDRSTWRDKSIRLYDPSPNPNQTVGNCTTCAKAMQLNAIGNRVKGRVLDMGWALGAYEWETHNDEFPGAWNRDGSGQDTGSSGLSSCKTAIHFGDGAAYQWEFGGADGVVANIMAGRAMSLGTWWYWDMFKASGGVIANRPLVKPTGGHAGGHQWIARGYDVDRDLVLGRCWWGTGPASEVHRDFWITRTDLADLLADGGDAHFQRSV